jgi:hypothetical protein
MNTRGVAIKGFLKRLFGKRDSISAQLASPVVVDHTMLASPCAESQPRVVRKEWDQSGRSEVEGKIAPEGLGREPPAPDAPVQGVRYREGDRIGGRYEVLDIFGGPGNSGMGVVYKCFDRWDRRFCALKSFQDRPFWSARAAAIFRREAELWIAVTHHPHVVAARTIRKPDGRLYLVLEYIEPDDQGRNCLSDFLVGRPLGLDQALTWAMQCCWGMEHAAKYRIRCHRDLKPNNLACAHRRLKQWEAAFQTAQKTVELDAAFLDGWNTLGGLYHSTAKLRQDYQQAVDCYRKAVAIDPFFFDAWMNLAASFCGVEDAKEALKCYERAAEIDPESAEAVERRDAFRAALGGNGPCSR